MIATSSTTFAAVLRAELFRNGRRVAPYAMITLFIGNAVLWWAGGPAVTRGWATNGEFYIVRLLGGFSFMTLPLCTAVLMGDPVIRDFDERVDPLIFSKPVGRAAYLLGKFLGNFIVLVCCQAVFALTLAALQLFDTRGMVVGPARVLPYVRHFVFFVAVSHLALAALHFMVGTLTRSTRAVYGLAILLYPLYIAYQLNLRSLAPRWRVALDPLLFNWSAEVSRGQSAERLNALAVAYDADMWANRATLVGLAVACLIVVWLCFDVARESTTSASTRDRHGITVLRGPASRRLGREQRRTTAAPRHLTFGFGSLGAAIEVEFRLLRAERSLIVIAPLAVIMSIIGPLVYGVRGVAADASLSAAYAYATADTLLLLLLGIVVFYTGEAMHRDRELRVEPFVWSTRAPDTVVLLSKFIASLVLASGLMLFVALSSALLQTWRGHAPIDVGVYATAYLIIVAPTAVLAAAAIVALNVLLRDKYAAYVAMIGIVTTLFYLYSQGYDSLLYNPALYGRWTAADLASTGAAGGALVMHRIYCLALASMCLALAHVCFARPASRRLLDRGRLTRSAWSLVTFGGAVALTVVTAVIVARQT